jgi:hypothetical protein
MVQRGSSSTFHRGDLNDEQDQSGSVGDRHMPILIDPKLFRVGFEQIADPASCLYSGFGSSGKVCGFRQKDVGFGADLKMKASHAHHSRSGENTTSKSDVCSRRPRAWQ